MSIALFLTSSTYTYYYLHSRYKYSFFFCFCEYAVRYCLTDHAGATGISNLLYSTIQLHSTVNSAKPFGPVVAAFAVSNSKENSHCLFLLYHIMNNVSSRTIHNTIKCYRCWTVVKFVLVCLCEVQLAYGHNIRYMVLCRALYICARLAKVLTETHILEIDVILFSLFQAKFFVLRLKRLYII